MIGARTTRDPFAAHVESPSMSVVRPPYLARPPRHASRNKLQVAHGVQERKVVWDAMIDGRQKNAAEMREGKRLLQASKRMRDEERHRRIVERAVALRERGVGAEKQRILEEARLEQFRKIREEKKGRGAMEVLLKSRTEQRIAEMEQEEAELIEWLQAKNVEQREAYDELAIVVERRKAKQQPSATHPPPIAER